MSKTNEKLLIGILAGIIIAGAAAFAIQPALAGHGGVRAGTDLAGPSFAVLTLSLSDKV